MRKKTSTQHKSVNDDNTMYADFYAVKRRIFAYTDELNAKATRYVTVGKVRGQNYESGLVNWTEALIMLYLEIRDKLEAHGDNNQQEVVKLLDGYLEGKRNKPTYMELWKCTKEMNTFTEKSGLRKLDIQKLKLEEDLENESLD